MIIDAVKSLDKQNKLKSLSKKILLAVTSTFLIFVISMVILEIILRTEYSQYHVFGVYGELPKDLQPKINSNGFRDREHKFENPDSLFRIIVLGDSFTFGQGVADEELYVNKLSKLAGNKFEFINLSRMGWGTADQLNVMAKWQGWDKEALFQSHMLDININDFNDLKNKVPQIIESFQSQSLIKQNYLLAKRRNKKFDKIKGELWQKLESDTSQISFGLNYNPKIVLIGLVANDFIEISDYAGYSKKKKKKIPLKVIPFDSDALRFMVKNINKMFFSKSIYNDFDINKALQSWEKNVFELGEVLLENNILGIVVPLNDRLHPDAKYVAVPKMLKVFEKAGFSVIDIRTKYRKIIDKNGFKKLKALPNDGHPGPVLHSFYAQEIWKELKSHIERLQSINHQRK